MPNLAGYDVSDFAAEHTADELRAHIHAAALWEPSARAVADATSIGGVVTWMTEFDEHPERLAPPPAIISNVAYAGRVSLLAAREKSGKSSFVAAMLAALSRGAPFIGKPTTQGKVCMCDIEEHANDPYRRLKAHNAESQNVAIVSALPNGLDSIHEILAINHFLVLVLDTLPAFLAALGVSDFNSAGQVLPLMTGLATIAHESGTALVLLHHANKATGKYRDSTALGGAVDLIIEMTAPEGVSDPTRRDFTTRGRMPTDNFSVTLTDGCYALANSGESLEMRVLDVIRTATANGGTLSKSAIRSAVRGAVGRTDAALRSLAERGLVIYERGAGYTVPLSALAVDELSGTGPEW